MPAIGIVACAATAVAAGIALWRRYGSGTYLRFPTMFGCARVYQVEDDDGSPVRLLEVGGIVQSGTYVDERYTQLVFEYLKRYDLMFQAGRPIRRVAVLGCGGYDYPEHLIAYHPDVQVDAVEVDPAITAIARRYFFLDRLIEEYGLENAGNASASPISDAGDAPIGNGVGSDHAESGKSREGDGRPSCREDSANATSAPGAESASRLNLICADALAHLQTTDAIYDAIVNDCFDAGSPPAHLATREFAEAVHDRLAPGGLYLTNIVSPLEGPRAAFLRSQVALLGDVFEQVRVIPCDPDSLTEPDNVIVIATDGG